MYVQFTSCVYGVWQPKQSKWKKLRNVRSSYFHSYQNFQIWNRQMKIGSRDSEVFFAKGVLKICSKFTGEHPWKGNRKSILVFISTIQPLKTWPRCLCVKRVTKAWNFFESNFQDLNLFLDSTKSLCNWQCTRIPCDANAFHDSSAFFFNFRIKYSAVFPNRAFWSMNTI